MTNRTEPTDIVERLVVQVLTKTAATIFGTTLFVLDAFEVAVGMLGRRRRARFTSDEPDHPPIDPVSSTTATSTDP